MDTTTAKTTAQGILINKKVVLMPVPRDGAMITDKKHIGYFMYDGTKAEFVVPLRKHGGLLPILTSEEQEFFEEKLREDLSFTKKKDNFWHTFRVTITKDSSFMEEGFTLDLSDITDNLKWRVLRASPSVAPTWEERYESGEYRFALTDPGHQEAANSARAEKMKAIYRHFAGIDSSRTKMYDFLNVHWMQVPKSRRPDPESTIEIFKSMIQDIIDGDPNSYVAVIEDANYETKLFINRAMVAGYIDRLGIKGDYNIDGRFLGKNLNDAVRNILSSEYHDDLLRIRALLDNESNTDVPDTTKEKIRESNEQPRVATKINKPNDQSGGTTKI